MKRGGVFAGVGLLWWLFGPLVLVLFLLSLLHPEVRRRLRPDRPSRRVVGVTAAVLGMVVAVGLWAPGGWLPIPSGEGRWSTPAYLGRAAIAHPVAGLRAGPHVVRHAGPEGDRTEVDTAWRGSGAHLPSTRPWSVSRSGRVRLAHGGRLSLSEHVSQPPTVAGAVAYVVTDDAAYRLSRGPAGRPRVDWRTTYDNGIEVKDGQASQGSGTSPTVLAGGYVAITDNADPRMRVLLLDRSTGREVCRTPVFSSGHSATASPLVPVGPAAVVVTNTSGYTGPLATVLGRTPPGGMARVDLAGDRCKVTWTNDVVAPSGAGTVSAANGLLYAWTTRHSWLGVSAWYLSAVDTTTGHPVFSVRAGIGAAFNNDGAPVVLHPDGSATVTTLAGEVRLHDR